MRLRKGCFFEDGGFWLHYRIPAFGASPDYLLPDGLGLVEIKCPLLENHIEHFDSPDFDIDEDYKAQMMAQLACTGRQYVDYVSYHPGWPEDLQFFVKRFQPDRALVRGLELEVEFFLSQVERYTNDLKHRKSKVVVMKAAR